MVDITAENWGDEHGKQWEDSKDRLCTLTHITHITIGDESDDREGEHAILTTLGLLEVTGETESCYYQHDDILDNGDTVTSPECTFCRCRQREIAL